MAEANCGRDSASLRSAEGERPGPKLSGKLDRDLVHLWRVPGQGRRWSKADVPISQVEGQRKQLLPTVFFISEVVSGVSQNGSGQWPVVAGIILVDTAGHILLQHRGEDAPSSPNTWGTPGGHLEADETPEQAVRREVLEETGLQLDGPLALFSHIYICRAPGGEISFIDATEAPLPGYEIIRDVSIFWCGTTARESDLVLGEGKALAFLSAEEALARSLALSTSHVLPLFLKSAEYRELAGATQST